MSKKKSVFVVWYTESDENEPTVQAVFDNVVAAGDHLLQETSRHVSTWCTEEVVYSSQPEWRKAFHAEHGIEDEDE